MEQALLQQRGFNPRSRGGSDGKLVSSGSIEDSFNPRSRGGSDYLLTQATFGIDRFQSTLPRRED